MRVMNPSWMRGRHGPIRTALLALALAALPDAPADDHFATPAAKAQAVYRIARFVDWPGARLASPTAPLRVCAVQGHPILAEFKRLDRSLPKSRPLRVVEAPGADQVAAMCDVYYVSHLADPKARQELLAIGRAPVLTVVEAGDLYRTDSVVTLAVVEDQLLFAINLIASGRAGLGVGAQLLQLATVVESRGG